jgi:hypothetical protein
MGTTTLGWVMCATLLAAALVWVAYAKPWQGPAIPPPSADPELRKPVAAAVRK